MSSRIYLRDDDKRVIAQMLKIELKRVQPDVRYSSKELYQYIRNYEFYADGYPKYLEDVVDGIIEALSITSEEAEEAAQSLSELGIEI